VQWSGGCDACARAAELFAVVKRPAGALQAALAMQRSVRARAWPDGVSVRVRIGIHTGRPTLTDSGYVGLAVHTAARICAAGHGGQVLLSEATVRAMELAAPAGGGFPSLGEHRRQGLPEPEALFQLEAPDLLARFPPPRTVPRAAVARRRRAGARG